MTPDSLSSARNGRRVRAATRRANPFGLLSAGPARLLLRGAALALAAPLVAQRLPVQASAPPAQEKSEEVAAAQEPRWHVFEQEFELAELLDRKRPKPRPSPLWSPREGCWIA